jgi:membrane associated rhomboid family serine protease
VKPPYSSRIPIAILFAVLWSASMMWWAPAIEPQTVATAVVAGAIVGGLMYWLLDKFSTRS